MERILCTWTRIWFPQDPTENKKKWRREFSGFKIFSWKDGDWKKKTNSQVVIQTHKIIGLKIISRSNFFPFSLKSIFIYLFLWNTEKFIFESCTSDKGNRQSQRFILRCSPGFQKDDVYDLSKNRTRDYSSRLYNDSFVYLLLLESFEIAKILKKME